MSSIGRGLTQFSQGINPGIAALAQALQQRKQQEAGAAVVGGLLGQQDGAPQPQAPGPAAAPPPAGMAALAQPLPPTAGGPRPPSAPPAAPASPPLNLSGGGGAPGGAPMPPSPGAGAPPPRDPSMSGVASPTGGGFAMDAQATLRSIAQNIAKANPGIKPTTLFSALQQQVGLMKGVAPEDRAFLQAQAYQLRTEATYQAQLAKAQTAADAAQIKAEYYRELADHWGRQDENFRGRTSEMGRAAEVRAAATTGAAGIRAGAARDVANIGAASRERVASTGAASRERVAGAGAASRERVASISARARENAAAIATGQKPPNPDAPLGGNAGPRASQSDISYLRAHGRDAKVKAAFDAHFGKGAADAALR